MIPADDRGFALGDGLFETVLARAGDLMLWDAHMARLARGCDVLGMPVPDAAACRRAAEGALFEAGLHKTRAAVRLSWTAGSGGRGVERPTPLKPRLIVSASPRPVDDGPLRLHTAAVRRNDASPGSRLKAMAYLDNVLARREANAAGADEALMLNTRGELACAAAANLFWLSGRTLMTPALECGVLDGTLRGLLIERAQAAGWSVQAVRAGPEALADADAIFLTNCVMGVKPVAALDGRMLEPHATVSALAAMVADSV
jgi:branched-chain amino acid aminotransferase/4-amino-4-deoxychorismate lyase